MIMPRYAAKRDFNQPEIEAAFRQMLGDHVTNTSAWGDGAGDLYISFGGETRPALGIFVEIKRNDKATLTAHQVRFHNRHPGCIFRIETVDEAIQLAQWVRSQVGILSRGE